MKLCFFLKTKTQDIPEWTVWWPKW